MTHSSTGRAPAWASPRRGPWAWSSAVGSTAAPRRSAAIRRSSGRFDRCLSETPSHPYALRSPIRSAGGTGVGVRGEFVDARHVRVQAAPSEPQRGAAERPLELGPGGRVVEPGVRPLVGEGRGQYRPRRGPAPPAALDDEPFGASTLSTYTSTTSGRDRCRAGSPVASPPSHSMARTCAGSGFMRRPNSSAAWAHRRRTRGSRPSRVGVSASSRTAGAGTPPSLYGGGVPHQRGERLAGRAHGRRPHPRVGHPEPHHPVRVHDPHGSPRCAQPTRRRRPRRPARRPRARPRHARRGSVPGWRRG